jgi:hypothetical protein
MEGQHAFLSASKYHWVGYNEEKLTSAYANYLATQRGTELHDFACRCIRLGQKLPNSKKTLNMYVNDAIGFRMEPEQMLVYSDNCFGTADSICFRKNFLRIHDLKTGSTKASIRQLEIYEALFCLEYNINPTSIGAELRLYQSDEIIVHEPHPEDIIYIMDKIILFDKKIEKMRIGE